MGVWNGVELSDLILSGPRLTLRRFRASDTPTVLQAMQDETMHRFLPLPDPYTETDAKEFVLGFAQAGRDTGTSIESAVVETSTRRLVGAAGLRLPSGRAMTAEIGYAVYPPARGHGYAAEATRLLAAWGFEHDLARIQLRAAVGNLASVKSGLNAGFGFEGIQRSGVLTSGGMSDAAVLSRLPTDTGDSVARSFPALPSGGLSDGVVALRVPIRSDAHALWAGSNDPEARRWTFDGTATTELEAITRSGQAGLDWLVGGRGPFVMVDVASGAVAGSMVLRLAGPPGVVGIGYGVHPAWRGRGFTARCLRLVRTWALGAGGFHRLELGTKIDNIASQRAALAGGFTRESTRVARLRTPRGTFSTELPFVAVRPPAH